MIGHESALESEEDLARFVKKEMKPADVDEAGMFMGKEAESDDGKLQEESQSADIDLNAIIKLIPDLFQKRSYGFHADDFSRFSASHEPESSSSSPANSLEIPTTLQLNRWEAREMKLIPQKEGSSRVLKARDLMEQRKKVRNEAREEAKALVKQLSVEDVDAMLGVKLQNGQEGDTGGPMEIDEVSRHNHSGACPSYQYCASRDHSGILTLSISCFLSFPSLSHLRQLRCLLQMQFQSTRRLPMQTSEHQRK